MEESFSQQKPFPISNVKLISENHQNGNHITSNNRLPSPG
jgi:hypothetical protein